MPLIDDRVAGEQRLDRSAIDNTIQEHLSRETAKFASGLAKDLDHPLLLAKIGRNRGFVYAAIVPLHELHHPLSVAIGDVRNLDELGGERHDK
jgi:hypothetical protein